jgi:hypothetical protein
MPKFVIQKGPRFVAQVGIIDATDPDEAARIAGNSFFECDRVERLTGSVGEVGTFLTTLAAPGSTVEPGERFRVV